MTNIFNKISAKYKSFRILAVIILLCFAYRTTAQEYVPAIGKVDTGNAPGMKYKLLSSSGQTKTYVLVFEKGDEVVSGLTTFAQRLKIKSAHYKGLGDALTMNVGWYDYQRKQFKVIPVDSSEITSFIGDIAMFDDNPVAHTHVSGSTSDGIVHGGHLLKMIVGPTLEVFVTVEPTPMFKRLNKEFEAGVIDPDRSK